MSSSATKLTALALVPDIAAWPAIQAVRFEHDRQVRIWPPHINLLYPFVEEAKLESAATQLAKVAQQLGPLKLIFQRKGRFGSTAFLIPECPEDPGLARLHSLCVSAFPHMKLPARAFVPHLTIGQFKSEAECQAFLESSPSIAIEADVGYLSVLARAAMQQPFRTAWRVVLGGNPAVAVEQGSSQPYTSRAADACQAGGVQENQAEWEEIQTEAKDNAKVKAGMKSRKESGDKTKLDAKEKAMQEAEEKAKKNMEDKAKHEAEGTTRKEVEAKAKKEAEENAKRQVVSKFQDVIVEYNRSMHGWEVPMPLQLRAELGTMVDNTEGNKVAGALRSLREVSSQVVAERNGAGVEKVRELSWAARLLQKSPSLTTSCKVRTVTKQQNATRIQKCATPEVRHVQKTVNQQQHHSAKLQSNLPRGHLRVQNHRRHPLKTSTDMRPKFIKSETVSKPKTDPSMWPAVRSGEIEFMLDSPLSISPTRSVCSPSLMVVGNFSFKILLFPRGTHCAAGKHLSAFVLAEPGDVEPDCTFKNVNFDITLVNWTDFTRSEVKSDTFSFKASGPSIDRGWHELVTVDKMTNSDSEWVGPTGSVCVRARCQVSSPGQQWSSE